MQISEKELLSKKLVGLKIEHEKLDQTIENLSNSNFSSLEIQRLKKEKLRLKDEIILIEAELYPNITA